MIGLPAGTRIWLAAGITDMRARMNGLATKVETVLAQSSNVPSPLNRDVPKGRMGQ